MARRILHPALLVRCWGSCDFHKFSAQRTAVTPLSRAARASSPQGEPWCGAFPQAFCKSPLRHGRAMRAPTYSLFMITYSLTKKNRSVKTDRFFFVLALPIFLCRQSIVPPMAGLNVLCRICMRKATCRWQVAFQVLALPIFPCSRPQSIVGEGELNFCVRDGNRWTLTPINTNCVEANSVSFASV